jgi:hypothetical protein
MALLESLAPGLHDLGRDRVQGDGPQITEHLGEKEGMLVARRGCFVLEMFLEIAGEQVL